MPWILRWLGATPLPVEAEVIRPDTLAGYSAKELSRLPVAVGNGTAELGSLFDVQGDGSGNTLIVEGDLRSVARIGQGMASGRLEIRGQAGRHLASGMAGGEVHVSGDVGDWAGAEMRGGHLYVQGHAGDHLGSAYPGSRLGMREGLILVEGSAGSGVGLGLRRGLIAVGGAIGEDAGRDLIAGTIFAFGSIGPGAGSGMKRGTLALLGDIEPELLPSFVDTGRDRPPFLTIYLRQLQSLGFPIPENALTNQIRRYNGDLAVSGQGEIFVGCRD